MVIIQKLGRCYFEKSNFIYTWKRWKLFRSGNLVSRQTVNEFISSHNAHLTVMENGEHWFHTDEQLAFLDSWMKKAIG